MSLQAGITLPKTNLAPWKWAETQKEWIVFQPSIFRCQLLVSGRVTPQNSKNDLQRSQILEVPSGFHVIPCLRTSSQNYRGWAEVYPSTFQQRKRCVQVSFLTHHFTAWLLETLKHGNHNFLVYVLYLLTLPQTHIAPPKWWLAAYFAFGFRPTFRVRFLFVLGRVGSIYFPSRINEGTDLDLGSS